MKIVAVVVTYNRKILLSECISALNNQTRKPEEIILIDNGSTDGTFDYIKEQGLLSNSLCYHRNEKNLGGAGGFYIGMRLAYEKKADWIWIMDDDTIPEFDALENLEEALKILNTEQVSYLASSVFGANGEPMNVPDIDRSSKPRQYTDWYRHLGDGIVKINRATFVSLLINRNAIKTCGLPCKDYFIWGDDTEYTIRITRNFAPAYFVGKSKVIHKRDAAKPVFIADEENPNRVKMYYYLVRNSLINTEEHNGTLACFRLILGHLHVCWTILLHKTMKKLKIVTILRALKDFCLRKYDVAAFKNRFEWNGQEKAQY